MSAPADSDLVAAVRALVAKQGGPAAPADSDLVAAVRALVAKQGGPAAPPSPAAPDQTRPALLARLAVATDNAERWNLAERINAMA